MNKNAVKITIENGDDAEDIQIKRNEAHQKAFGGFTTGTKPLENNSLTYYPKSNNPPSQNSFAYNNSSKKVEESKVKKYVIGGDNQEKRS